MEGKGLNWRKSSHSGGNGGSCIEVASDDAVMVRDSKDKGGAKLAFTPDTWRKFTTAVKRSLAPDPSQL